MTDVNGYLGAASPSTGSTRHSASIVRLGHIAIAAQCLFAITLLVQNGHGQTTDGTNKSWSTTADSTSNNTTPIRVPTRTIETHRKDGNQTIEERSVQIAADGRYQTYQDIETQTVQVDASTVRSTTRTFGQDANGARALVQVVQEEERTMPRGESQLVRTVSNPDLNGVLQTIERDVVETKKVAADGEQKKTTVMLPNLEGGLSPVFKTDEVLRRMSNTSIESEKTTLIYDGAGNWQVNEVRKATIREEGATLITDERTFARDAEGKLGLVSHVVSKQSETASGEKSKVVEKSSVDVPGTTRDGSLHLVERSTTTRGKDANGSRVTEQTVERPDPGNPDSGLRVYLLENDSQSAGRSGKESTVSIRGRDLNGDFGVVWVDTTKSDPIPKIQIHQEPSPETK